MLQLSYLSPFTLVYTVTKLSLDMMLGFLSITAAWGLVLLLIFPDTSCFKNSLPSWGFQCSVLCLQHGHDTPLHIF